jgi:hypothetical protein
MGMMDKLKQQATTITQQGKAKAGEFQAKREIEKAARDLGLAVYHKQAGDSTLDDDIARLTAVLRQHAAEGATIPRPGSEVEGDGTSETV